MIDFAAIADQFRQPLLQQTAPTVLLFEKLVDAVKDLVRKADEAERATRAYPILRYRDGAVGVRLALGPVPVLTVVTDPGVAEGLRRHGTGFLDGLGWAGTAVRQEVAANEIAGSVLGMLRAVADSLDRYATAAPSMFDDRRARFSDVFGLLNLAWSSLLGAENQAQIRRAAQGGLAGAELAQIVLSLLPQDPPALAVLGGVQRLREKLDEKAKLFLDVVLLLPVVGLTVDLLVHEGVYAAEHKILVELSAVERQVYDLRSAVVDAWLAAFGLGGLLHFYAEAAELVVDIDEILLAVLVPGWVGGVLDAVDHLLTGIHHWGVWAEALVRLFQVAAVDLMAVDLMPWIVANALPPWASRLPLPKLTLEDVVAYASGEGNPAVRAVLVEGLTELEVRLALIPGAKAAGWRVKVAALRDILNITLAPTPFAFPPDVLPSGPIGAFPNVYDALFGGGRRADLLDAVRKLGDGDQGGRGGHPAGRRRPGERAGADVRGRGRAAGTVRRRVGHRPPGTADPRHRGRPRRSATRRRGRPRACGGADGRDVRAGRRRRGHRGRGRRGAGVRRRDAPFLGGPGGGSAAPDLGAHPRPARAARHGPRAAADRARRGAPARRGVGRRHRGPIPHRRRQRVPGRAGPPGHDGRAGADRPARDQSTSD